VRWQVRTNIGKHARQSVAGLTIGAQQPAACDLALEAAARAVARLTSRRPRRANARSGRSSEPRASWVAVIVRSERVTGRPRQRLVRYVGSIDCADVQRLSERRRFWERADSVLTKFTPEERERFEHALETKVQRPTEEEVATATPAGILARFAAIRAARVQHQSDGTQAPIGPSPPPAPLTTTDAGNDNREVNSYSRRLDRSRPGALPSTCGSNTATLSAPSGA
jgi:hypothetical protein